ncbi:MAG: oligosaccharide flippase family protein, partial [Clostridium paraputrificum]
MATSVKRNAMAKMALNILNIVLPLVTGPYVARVLDSNLFGEYNKAFSILSWFLPFASFGIYNYGIRIISQNKNDKEKTRKIFTQLFIMGCISTIIVFFIYLLFVLFKPNKVNNLIYIVLSIQIIANIFMVEWMNEAFESYGFILFKTMIVRLFNVFSIFIFIRKSDDIV